jgi:hypothetical protein
MSAASSSAGGSGRGDCAAAQDRKWGEKYPPCGCRQYGGVTYPCRIHAPEQPAACVCGQRDAEREPDATDRVIVPTAADCPVHGSPARPVAHNGDVWRRVSEGSARAECDCGWKGPKRSYEGGLAHEDLIRHFDEVDGASGPTGHELAREVARRGS